MLTLAESPTQFALTHPPSVHQIASRSPTDAAQELSSRHVHPKLLSFLLSRDSIDVYSGCRTSVRCGASADNDGRHSLFWSFVDS